MSVRNKYLGVFRRSRCSSEDECIVAFLLIFVALCYLMRGNDELA